MAFVKTEFYLLRTYIFCKGNRKQNGELILDSLNWGRDFFSVHMKQVIWALDALEPTKFIRHDLMSGS